MAPTDKEHKHVQQLAPARPPQRIVDVVARPGGEDNVRVAHMCALRVAVHIHKHERARDRKVVYIGGHAVGVLRGMEGVGKTPSRVSASR